MRFLDGAGAHRTATYGEGESQSEERSALLGVMEDGFGFPTDFKISDFVEASGGEHYGHFSLLTMARI
jgi:hypothetical protein